MMMDDGLMGDKAMTDQKHELNVHQMAEGYAESHGDGAMTREMQDLQRKADRPHHLTS